MMFNATSPFERRRRTDGRTALYVRSGSHLAGREKRVDGSHPERGKEASISRRGGSLAVRLQRGGVRTEEGFTRRGLECWRSRAPRRGHQRPGIAGPSGWVNFFPPLRPPERIFPAEKKEMEVLSPHREVLREGGGRVRRRRSYLTTNHFEPPLTAHPPNWDGELGSEYFQRKNMRL